LDLLERLSNGENASDKSNNFGRLDVRCERKGYRAREAEKNVQGGKRMLEVGSWKEQIVALSPNA
jgi:hypothetical protein